MKKRSLFQWARASTALMIMGVAFGTTLTGCGGSGSGSSASRTSAPTDATRARVQSLYGQSIQSLTNSGTQTLAIAQERFSGAAGAGAGDVSNGGSATGAMGGLSTPYIGAFLRQNAIRGVVASSSVSRQEDGGDSGSGSSDPVGAGNGLYYDYYLGLWVDTTETPQKTTYTLYVDEAKQTPAGFIVTENPTDYETFPQAYRSAYEFTAGYLAGAHGFFNTTTDADYSGTSEYENVYAGGGKSTGVSRWGGQGDSTYQSREEMADGSWSESVGTFRSNGSGGTRFTTSDGYGAEYTFNANGTGRGKITGKEPGLPATIVWDTRGNTTITYADGSIERYGYGFGYGIGDIATTPAPPPVGEPVSTEPKGAL